MECLHGIYIYIESPVTVFINSRESLSGSTKMKYHPAEMGERLGKDGKITFSNSFSELRLN